MNAIYKIFLTIILVFSLNNHAGTLIPITDLNVAKVPPQGVYSLRYRNILANTNKLYTSSGVINSIRDKMTKTITFNDLLKLENPSSTLVEKGGLEGYLKAQDIDINENVGKVTGDLNISTVSDVFTVVYGITDKMMLALALPIIKYKLNVDTGFVANGGLKKLSERFRSEKRYYELDQLIEKMNDPVRTAISDYSYRPLQNEQDSKMGDLQTVLKYQVYNHLDHLVAIQGSVVVPIGDEDDINRLINIQVSDNQWDVGLSAIYEYQMVPELGFSTSLGYLWQVRDTQARRIPYDSVSLLSPDIDLAVECDLGDQFFYQIGSMAEIVKGLNFSASYAFQYKKEDSYKGSKFESYRYQFLERETIQRLETITFAFSYNTIPLVLKKQFPLPLEFNIGHTIPIRGKNVLRDPITMVELAMYLK